MGFVGFLRFSLLCLDFLAWPTFALIYPLWASIRAIETSSKYQMKKLVIYWTIFSLISLFEIFLVKLIQWVPFWPYIKLVSVFWLVMPRFDGACIAYQHLVHPCLSVNLQDIINWFCIQKEKPYNEDSFLASAETYLKENGPEALENLIASKEKREEHVLADADAMEVVKRVEPTEKNVTAEEQLVEQPKVELAESEEEEIAAPESQRETTPGESKEKRPIEIEALKKVQSEWTCAVCQFTTTSEATLNSHLQGRKHKSKCEKLKTSAQTKSNSEKLKTSAQTKSNSEELKTSKQTLNDLKEKSSAAKTNNSTQPATKNLKVYAPGERSIIENTTEKPNSTHGQQMQGKGKPAQKNALVQQQQKPRFWCSICNITCTGEIDMDSHLRGRNHKFNLEQQQKSRFWCSICNITCTGEIDMDSHLRGRNHKFNLEQFSSVGGIQG